MKRKGVNEEKL